MKMDFRGLLLALASLIFLSGCGKAQQFSANIDAAGASCSGAMIPQQYIVKHLDNSVEVIHAASDAAFVNGYLKANAGKIRYAEHDYRVHVSDGTPAPPTDPPPPFVTTADNWGAIKVDVSSVWGQSVRGAGVIVAVVDTGMDITHPQLMNQVYINPGESGVDAQGHPKQSNGIDDDANGYIDDYVGYDFANHQPLKGDNQFHGTHVSGILAAAHQDTVAAPQTYVQGMAPSVKLMPLAFMDSTGSGAISDAVFAIQYAVQMGAQVINASWGGTDCSQALKDEIASLAAKNVYFVGAAGNDSVDIDETYEYPASLDLAAQLTIGSTGDHDYMSQFSNFGAKSVHIFAPGEDIVSTIPGGMGILSGTSMATPFVAGAVALLLSAVPSATPTQIRSALFAAAEHSANYINVSQGRLDLAQALTQLHTIVGQ